MMAVNDTMRKQIEQKGRDLYDEYGSGSGTQLEVEFWECVAAVEVCIGRAITPSRENGRQYGYMACIDRWIRASEPTRGFNILTERGMHEFTVEYLALRYPSEFQQGLLDVAKFRLTEHGLKDSDLP